MNTNKLKLIKSAFKKATALTLIAGLLTTSYGIHLQLSPVAAQNNQWETVLNESAPRPDVCLTANISASDSPYNNNITLTASFSQGVKAVSFMFYNLDNKRDDGIPKTVEFTLGQPFGVTNIIGAPSTQTQATFNTQILNQPDQHANNVIPTKFQINAYGTLPDGSISMAKPNCVTYLTIYPQVTSTPTSSPTPTSTPTTVPTQMPTASPSPTPVQTTSPTPTPTTTTTPQPTITTSPTPTQTATASPLTPTPSSTPYPTYSPSTYPTLTASPTFSSTPLPTFTPTATASPIPTASPTAVPAGTSRIAFCMYHDKNANTLLEQGEDKLSWEFNYKINNAASNSINSNWWNFLSDGCANMEISKNAQISVDEETRSGWFNTAIWENGRKTSIVNQPYTFIATEDEYQIWFLASQTINPSPSPTNSIVPTISPTPTFNPSATPTIAPSSTITPTPTPTITPSPTPSNSPTPTPTTPPQYDVRIEKTVDGAEVRGDSVGIQYRIKIRNYADRDLSVRVVDELDSSFTYDHNTYSGDISTNPSLEDISGDDNRRLVWNDIRLLKGQEKTFTFRTTGRYEDKQFCNNARVEVEGTNRSESRACVRVNRSEGQVLAATQRAVGGGPKILPATGSSILTLGIGLIILSALGFKMAKYGDRF